MMEVKPLPTQRKVLTWLCIYYSDKNESKMQKIIKFSCYATFILSFISCITGSLMYYNKFASINLEESLFALYQIVAQSAILYMFLIAFLLKRQITGIFDELSTIYKASKTIYSIILICENQIKSTENSNWSESRVLWWSFIKICWNFSKNIEGFYKKKWSYCSIIL